MKKAFLLFILLSSALLLNAQNRTIQAPRLKVGVVLGGGGARGASHIGVLKYLEEMGIPVDYVAGTSMGSIMGGFYALGYPPEEIASLIANINWSEYIGNKIDRPLMSEEARQRSSTLLLQVPFSLESLFSSDSTSTFLSQLPSAYVNNASLINLFNNLCIGYQEEMDFNDLPIPFACVATDLITGEEVVMRSGSVPTSMRASMAIPGVFSPVTIGDKVLVDGGLVNNFPADVLRDMGADIIIGVEVTSNKDVTPADLQSLPQVLARLVTNSTSAKRVENREMCDIHIVPDCSGYGMLSFTPEAIETLVGRGYEKASEYHDQLKAIKDAVDASAGRPVTTTLHAPRARNLANDSVLIQSITINNVSGMESDWLIRKSHLNVGERYGEEEIERAMKVFRGTGCFDEISYQVKEHDSVHSDRSLSEAFDLHVNMKPAQPHVVGLGVRYDTEDGAALLFHLGLNEKKFGGVKFNTNIKLSYSPKVNFALSYAAPSLAAFSTAFDYRNEHFRVVSENHQETNLQYHQRKGSAYFSQFHLLNMNTRIGLSYAYTKFDRSSIEVDYPDDSTLFAANTLLTPYVSLEYDNLDDDYFAKRGIKANVTARYHMDDKYKFRHNYFDLSYAFRAYISPWNGRFTIIPQIYGRIMGGDPDYFNLLVLAGGDYAERHFDAQLPFIGLTTVEYLGSEAAVARCDLRYNTFKNQYLTAMYNICLHWSNFDLQGLSDMFVPVAQGAGLKYSYDSPVGPISLTVHWANTYERHLFGAYFSFGYTF